MHWGGWGGEPEKKILSLEPGRLVLSDALAHWDGKVQYEAYK